MKSHPEKQFAAAAVAVDVALFCIKNQKLHVLLIELDRPEFPNKWALPGGLVTPHENLDEAVMRHLKDRGGEGESYIEQLGTYGDPDRDPTGWVVSVAYLALTTSNTFVPKTSSRYKSVAWVSLDNLPELAYDHKKILADAVLRLKSKLNYSNIVFALLPHEFTFTELQDCYEVILEKHIDKRNFRKKMLSLNLLEEVQKVKATGAHRPAQLYRFKERALHITQTL
jgi:8-oxo-dGTP diphosphatase